MSRILDNTSAVTTEQVCIDHAANGIFHDAEGNTCLHAGMLGEPDGYVDWLVRNKYVVLRGESNPMRYENGYMSEECHYALTDAGRAALDVDAP